REGDRDASRRRWQRLEQEEVGERRILMAGEAAVSDSISLAWVASLASIAVAVVYKRDPRSATPWGLLISGGTALPLAGHPFA
ncbi:hypothetical protein, partial [Klebsiella variicola]|uniref:hypothetical protein n=1 Tax=Klebsiella variicola TaxID=244366 RepID=UPI003B7C2407